jgi:DNA-directed RNA polymerase specialized sigma24 family protein
MDPVTGTLVREQLASLQGAWPTLSAKERAALAGTLSGKSHQQLADELNCTPKAIGRAVSRARHKLARHNLAA